MFVKAIEIASKFTRPFKSIYRCYGSTEVEAGCATFIIVNEDGWILTCKHVALQHQIAEQAYEKYIKFKKDLSTLPKNKHRESSISALEKKYGYNKKKSVLIQQKNIFKDVVDKMSSFDWHYHPKYDIALIHFNGFDRILCDRYPVFAKDSSVLKQGLSLCRLGYPYPEFNDFKYDAANDDIEWSIEGREDSPLFPIDGILTRLLCSDNGEISGIELSTPGLKGQSGGPLFDVNGIVYGMQSVTASLPLGFDQENREIKVNGVKKKVNDYSFIHLGRCVHVDIIKDFMDKYGVKYHVG